MCQSRAISGSCIRFCMRNLFSIHGLLLQPHFSHKLLHEQISTKNNGLLFTYTKVSRVEWWLLLAFFVKFLQLLFEHGLCQWRLFLTLSVIAVNSQTHYIAFECAWNWNLLMCQRMQTNDVFLIKTSDVLLMLFVKSSFWSMLLQLSNEYFFWKISGRFIHLSKV